MKMKMRNRVSRWTKGFVYMHWFNIYYWSIERSPVVSSFLCQQIYVCLFLGTCQKNPGRSVGSISKTNYNNYDNYACYVLAQCILILAVLSVFLWTHLCSRGHSLFGWGTWVTWRRWKMRCLRNWRHWSWRSWRSSPKVCQLASLWSELERRQQFIGPWCNI